MIDIGVTGLVKSFDLEKTILEGLTLQIDTGERVGILVRNGAGKTTLFKILTGELDYDEGEVFIAPGKRLGLISQIPVYPAKYTAVAYTHLQIPATDGLAPAGHVLCHQGHPHSGLV